MVFSWRMENSEFRIGDKVRFFTFRGRTDLPENLTVRGITAGTPLFPGWHYDVASGEKVFRSIPEGMLTLVAKGNL